MVDDKDLDLSMFENTSSNNKKDDDKDLDFSMFEDAPDQEISQTSSMTGIPDVSNIEQDLLAGSVQLPQGEMTAALRGAVQEGTFGLADEIGGAANTLLSDFTDPNAPKDIEGMIKKYQAMRDSIRKDNKKLEEDFPKSYTAGQIAGGIIPALATGGAGVAAQAAKQGGKQLAKLGAKVGAQYGAAQGLGRSEAEVLERDLGGLLKDVGSEALLGGGVGGVLPMAGTAVKGAGKAVSGALESIPGAEAVKAGYKLGKEGISASYKSLMDEFGKLSKGLSTDIRTALRKEGVSKVEALELADAIGISLNAGDPIETAIEKAMNLKNVPESERGRFTTFLQELIGQDPKLNKKIQKIDAARAKQIEKAARDGFEVESTEAIGKRIEDIVPDSSVQGTLVGSEDLLKKTTEEGKEITKKVLNLQTLADDVNAPNIDVTDLTPTQMEDLIKQVNKFANPSKKDNVTEVESVARGLAAEFRNMSNKATAGTSVESVNTNIAALIDAVKQTGMKGKVSSKAVGAAEGSGARFLREEQERQLQKKLMDSSQFGDVDTQSLFSRLKEVDPKFEKFEQRSGLLKDAMGVVDTGMASGSTSLKGLMGGAQRTVALLGNVAGKAVKKLEGASPSKTLLTTGKLVREATPDSIQNILNAVEGTQAYKAFIPALQEAASATTDASRKLIMFGLHQQPAFREMLRSIGAGADQKHSSDYSEQDQEQSPSLDNKTSSTSNIQDVLQKYTGVAGNGLRSLSIPEAAAADSPIPRKDNELDNIFPTSVFDQKKNTTIPLRPDEQFIQDNIDFKTMGEDLQSNIPIEGDIPSALGTYEKFSGYKKNGRNIDEFYESPNRKNKNLSSEQILLTIGALKAILTGANLEGGHGVKTKGVTQIDPFTGEVKTYKGSLNVGFDFKPEDSDPDMEGVQMKAAFPGEVVLSGVDEYSPGHGNSVIVKNNQTITVNGVEYDVYSAYGHNKDNLVTPGQSIDSKTNISTMGGSTYKNGKLVQGEYPDHGDIRTFVVPRGGDWNVKNKVYINPKQLELAYRQDLLKNRKKLDNES